MWAAGTTSIRDRAAVDAVADVHFADTVEPGLAEQPSGAGGRQYLDGGPDSLEGGKVQMVEVDVREQDEVDVVQIRRRQRTASPEVRNPLGQQRIGDDPVPADVDERCGMPRPGQFHQAPRVGIGAVAGRSGTVHGAGALPSLMVAIQPLNRWWMVAAPTIGSSGNSNPDGNRRNGWVWLPQHRPRSRWNR